MQAALLTLVLATAAIDPRAIKAHIDFLASDHLEGREAGTRGYDIAAQYVATQLAAAGVEPAGDDGTYFHRARFRTYRLDTERSSFCLQPLTRRSASALSRERERGAPQEPGEGLCAAFEHRKDVLISAGNDPERVADAEIVHAGFGIVAPELEHDDYRGLDVRGKIVAILAGAPPRFPHSHRAHYSGGLVKMREAAARGAIGIINIRTLDSERRFPWERTIARGDTTGFRAVDERGAPYEDTPQIRASATLGPRAIEALFANEKLTATTILADADKGVAHAFPLNKRATIRSFTAVSETTSPNVAGIVRGSDPKLVSEHVVLTAHLDHLGLRTTGDDRVYNGALDNASGIAALLEIGRKLAALPKKPARSIVLVAVTAEEKGVQGSLAFAQRPPLEGPIVANVNMDMLTMLFPVRGLVALGLEHSTLGPLSREAARKAGFTIEEDPQPEEVRFIRSDQYSFVKLGIPAISYKGGLAGGDKLARDWLRNVYHSVDDDPDQKLDYASGARWAEANYELLVMIANAKQRPRWNEGDFFGKLFGK